MDARQRFEMHEAWQPDEVSLKPHLRLMTVSASEITPELLAEFISFWMTRSTADNQAGWCRALVKRAHDLKTLSAGVQTHGSATRSGRSPSSITLADNLSDADWAEGLEPM